jgi:hypothetical protein
LKKTSILLSVALAGAFLWIGACKIGTPNIALYDVTGTKTAVIPGATIDFGTAYVITIPHTQTRNFSIENTGTADLSLTGASGKVVISGTDAANYGIPTQPPASVPAGGSVAFDIVFTPTTTGGPATRNATIGIDSDDPDAASLSFNVTGIDQYS